MQIGYSGIILLMILSPLPPEVFMPLAGFLTAQGEMSFVLTVLAGVFGFLISVLPWYFAGRYLGEKGLQQLLKRHRKWLAFSNKTLAKAKRWFDRYGEQAIFLSLLLPGTRNFISIPAGLSGMPLTTFLLYATLGSAFWMTLLTGAGYFLGNNYYLVHDYLGSAYNVVFAVLGIAIVVWAIRRYTKHKEKE
jgi:membrane protein DedA with SNARE-associated domain